MPGASSDDAPQDAAPESLDHFKRGYRERVEMRERGLSGLRDKPQFNHPATRTAGGGYSPYRHE